MYACTHIWEHIWVYEGKSPQNLIFEFCLFLLFIFFYYYYYYWIWRCLWCNGYYLRKWTQRPEFKSWTWLFAFMGFMKDHFVIYSKLLGLSVNSEIHIWFFFFFLPHSLLLFVEAVREPKTEEKYKDTFRLKFYFRVYNYSMVWNVFLNQ